MLEASIWRAALRVCRQIALSTKPEASFEHDSPTFFEQSALQAAASHEVCSIQKILVGFFDDFFLCRNLLPFHQNAGDQHPCLLCASKTHACSFHVALSLPLKPCRLTCCEQVALIRDIGWISCAGGFDQLIKLDSVVSSGL
jgi:hypothetical protein